MAVKIENRIPELIETLEMLADRDHHRRQMRKAMAEAAPVVHSLLKRRAPDGGRWVEPGLVNREPRPSLRLFGMTLAMGWNEPEIETIAGRQAGAQFVITSAAPHMEYLLAPEPRARDYQIPRRIENDLVFYWHRFSKWMITFGVTHPGSNRSTFVDDAWLGSGEDSTTLEVQRGLEGIVLPLRRFFGQRASS